MSELDKAQFGQDVLMSADAQTGEIQVRDFEAEGVVNLNESRLQLLHVLELFKQINQRERFYGHPEAAEVRYGENAERAREGALRNRNDLEDEARKEHSRSLGLFVVEANQVDFPDFDLPGFKKEVKRYWTVFQAKFRGDHPVRISARNEFMRRLRSDVTTSHSYYNRSVDSRPYITKQTRTKELEHAGREYPLLNNRQRLEALQTDPRARFLPYNDKEKNKVFTWLDYLDNPEYPLGTYNQLLEIHTRQQKKYKVEGASLALASRTLRSVVYELHDHLEDALKTQELLEDFNEQTAGVNPRLSVLEVIDANDPIIPVLIRYRDVARYRDEGKLPQGIKNPLATKEDRREHPGTDKNKTVEDIYTGRANMTPEMNAYLLEEAGTLDVKEARKLMRAVMRNEVARAGFHSDRLREVSEGLESRFLPTALARDLLVTSHTLHARAA